MDIFKADIFKVNLATNQVPKYTVDMSKGIVKQGKKNDYSNYLLFLLNNHAEHGAIVRGKAKYVTGLDIKPKDEKDIQAAQFLLRANVNESWLELTAKTDLDDAVFGGHYELIQTNLEGTPITWEHIPYTSVRLSEDMNSFKVCDNWNSSQALASIKCYPKFNPGFVGTSILYVKEYVPSENKISGAYAQPEYVQCTLDIDTDIRVGSFFNNFIKNNFSSGTMVTIFNGETDAIKQKNIVDRFKLEYTGEDEAGKPVVVFAPKDGKGAEVQSLNSSDLDKQYQEVSKRNKEKIISGHGVPAQLFKVKVDDRALFSRNELVEAQELFINEYAKQKQAKKLKRIQDFYSLCTGKKTEYVIEQIQNIGLDLLDPNLSKYLTNDEVRDKLGLPEIDKSANDGASKINDALNAMSPLVATKVLETLTEDEIRALAGLPSKTAPKLDQDGNVIQEAVKQEAVNENLKNLTGRQFQGLMRIVKKYDDKKISKETAVALMRSGFGVSEQEALTFLNIADEDEATSDKAIAVQQSQDKTDLFFSLMDRYSKDVTDDEVLERKVYNGHSTNFATATSVTITELRNAILNQIKGNPYLSVYDLSKTFGVDESVINDNLNWLSDKKLIDTSEGSFTPTEKAIGKETEPIETEIYTEYTYGLREDLPAKSATGESNSKLILSTTRPFCEKMVTKYARKAVDYSVIDKLNNDFGDNAFEYRGGYYNDGNNTTPWCRHVWVMETKIRRKK